MAWIPAAIGAGASLLGGMLGRESQKEQMDMQREFAQSGIQWKVADAKAAGVHPLFALGASTAGYSPTYGGGPMASAVSEMGQNLSRAAAAQQSAATIAHLEALTKQALSAANKDDVAAAAMASEQARRDQAMGLAIGGTPAEVGARAVAYPVSVPAAIRGIDLPSVGSSPRERYVVGASGVGRPAAGPEDWSYDAAKVGTARLSDPSVAAGPPRPMFEEYRIGTGYDWASGYGHRLGEFAPDRGLYIVLPAGGNASEAIEAISEGGGHSPVSMAIYAENVRRYGLEYVNQLREYLRDNRPSVTRRLADQLMEGASYMRDRWRSLPQ